MIGVLLPEDNIIHTRDLSRTSDGRLQWPRSGSSSQSFGGGFGTGNAQFVLPISFDVGPEGRVFVLDADNACIQVFAADGNYLTQWGSAGGAPGEFNFRLDANTRSGSIAIDDDGFIYVADVGNKRIQKFAP